MAGSKFMNLLIISSSQRTGSQSAKVGNYLASVVNRQVGAEYGKNCFDQITHLELCRFQLPYWNGEEISKDDSGNSWQLIKHKISQAEAYIFITPEWGGMASPLLKNFLLMCEQQNTGHKPALLVSVSSGISGAYPIAELRMNALKNNKIVAVPDHLIIRNVVDVLNIETEFNPLTERDINLRERIDYTLFMLFQYAKALKTIRVQHQLTPYPKQQEYAYGM